MHIRKLKEDDYPAALELFCALDDMHIQARPDWFSKREKAEVFPQDAFVPGVNDPECLFLGAFAEEKLIGLVRATLYSDSGMIKGLANVCLDNIYVLPAYRRQGIASELYRAVETWAKENNAQRLELHVWNFNQDALAAYEAWGLKPQRYVLEKELQYENH